MPSRVGTSQPQAFAFDVHAQTHAAKLWSPGFCMRRTWGERAKGAVGNRGDSRSKTESICRVTQDKPSSRQSISLTSHVSDERRARARKPCVGEDLRLRCFARLAQQASVSSREEAKLERCTAEGMYHAARPAILGRASVHLVCPQRHGRKGYLALRP